MHSRPLNAVGFELANSGVDDGPAIFHSSSALSEISILKKDRCVNTSIELNLAAFWAKLTDTRDQIRALASTAVFQALPKEFLQIVSIVARFM